MSSEAPQARLSRPRLGRLGPSRSATVAGGFRPGEGRVRRLSSIVDEAHLIDDPATFEALRLVLNFATVGPPDLALLLVGGPDLAVQNLPPEPGWID